MQIRWCNTIIHQFQFILPDDLDLVPRMFKHPNALWKIKRDLESCIFSVKQADLEVVVNKYSQEIRGCFHFNIGHIRRNIEEWFANAGLAPESFYLPT